MKNGYKILIFGGSGQDGTILTDLYSTEEGVSVVTIGRKYKAVGKPNKTNIKRLVSDLAEISVLDLLNHENPDIIIYTAAYHGSFGIVYEESIDESFVINVKVPTQILEYCKNNPHVKFAYFNSSKVFDFEENEIITEESTRKPNCVYSLQKELTYKAILHYRLHYNVLAYNFWLFNHESVYRKPSYFIPQVISTFRSSLIDRSYKKVLHCLDFYCDWGVADDYMKIVKKLLALPKGGDFILATGRTLTGRELISDLSEALGLDYTKHFSESNPNQETLSARWKVDISKLQRFHQEKNLDIKQFCLQQIKKHHE